MALLAIQDGRARLGVRSGALAVFIGGDKKGHVVRKLPVHEVDEVHIYGDATMSPAARRLLLRRGVDVLFFSGGGFFLGRLFSKDNPNAQRRCAQYQRLIDESQALALAKMFVAGKLKNQRFLLQKRRRDYRGDELAGALAALRQVLKQVPRAMTLDELRGMEGHGASMYFTGLGASVRNPAFSFEKRTRRPPRDPINACLSFGYTLLLRRAESAVRRAGLDVFLGALHAPGRGRPSLALDLMEEFRPVVVDRLVLRLVNRKQLQPEDFEEPNLDLSKLSDAQEDEGNGGEDVDRPRPVYLGPTGREIFLRAYGRVWRQRYRIEGLGRVDLRAIIDHQAMGLAHWLEGKDDAYRPFCLR